MNKKIGLAELQEITFWQQLNKQLVRFSGSDIADNDSRIQYLENFCFDNSLFTTLRDSSITRDIPLSLFTNLSTLGFISINDDQWNLLLGKLISTHGPINVFDIDCARTDAFEVITNYSNRFDYNDESDDDEELNLFISYYLDERDKYPFDFSRSVCDLHTLKATVLLSIINDSSHISISTANNELVINLSDCRNRDNLVMTYLERYCEQAQSRLTGLLQHNISHFPLDDFLIKKKSKYNGHPHVTKFIDHELSIFIYERRLISARLTEINRRIKHANDLTIRVCRSSPFYFLEDPLPLV